MGFGEGYLNVYVLCQKMFNMPSRFDIAQGRFIRNPQWGKKFPAWHVYQLAICTFFLYTINHFRILCKAYIAGKDVSMEEFIVYVVYSAGALHEISTGYCEASHLSWSVENINNMLHFGNVRYCGWPTSQRLPDFQELVAYGMGLALATSASVLGLAVPFIRPFDPISLELSGALSPTQVKFIAAFLYFILCFFGSLDTLCYLLRAMLVCQVIETKADLNLKLSRCQSCEKEVAWIESRFIQPVLKTFFQVFERLAQKRPKTIPFEISTLDSVETGQRGNHLHRSGMPGTAIRFRRRRHLHAQMNLLIDTSNQLVHFFVPCMTGTGIVICSIINYGILSCFDDEEVRLIIFSGIVLVGVIHCLILFFCKHASNPAILTKSMIQYWKGKLSGRLERRQFRSMRTLGFTIGPFFGAKRSTALDIMDTIVDCTISLLLG